MNKLESAYAAELERKRITGEIEAWLYEPVGLRIADRCTYNPDFLVILADGTVEFHETKGFWEDDALVKIKVAAQTFPWFVFRAFQFKQKQWSERVFEPR